MAPLSFTLGFENLIYFGQMNWLPNIRNIPELLVLKTASGNNPGTRSPRSTSERPSTVERQVCVLNDGMDPRLLPCTALGKRISATKILDAVKGMRSKGKDFFLRDDGAQKCHTWHAKGFCFSRCYHKADHVKRSTAKMNRFHEWCKEAFSE